MVYTRYTDRALRGINTTPSPPPTPQPFIFKIDTTILNNGSPNDSIRLPFQPNAYHYLPNLFPASGLNLNITVKWGDGQSDTYTTNPTVDYEVSHTYDTPGIYTIEIDGPSIQGWSYSTNAAAYDNKKLIEVLQFGDFDMAPLVISKADPAKPWNLNNLANGGAQYLFYSLGCFTQTDCVFNNSATDYPKMTGNAIGDVFALMQMNVAPQNKVPLNVPGIENWDTSNIVFLGQIFRGFGNQTSWPNGAFNQDISNWSMNSMKIVNFPITSWDFNYDVTKWDISNIEVLDGIVKNSEVWNFPLTNWIGKTSNLTSVRQLFASNTAFDQDVSVLNPANMDTTNLAYNAFSMMFFNCKSFQGTGCSSWDVSSVKQFDTMFSRCDVFNGDITNWDITGTHYYSGAQPWVNIFLNGSIAGMLSDCPAFDRDLSNWDVSNTPVIANFMSGTTKLSQTNYDNVLLSFASQLPMDEALSVLSGQPPVPGIVGSAASSNYWNFGLSKYTPGGAVATARTQLANYLTYTYPSGQVVGGLDDGGPA